jgi:methionine aminopeptidase
MRDGWTIRTSNRALAAHEEHTIVVRRDGPLVLTAA